MFIQMKTRYLALAVAGLLFCGSCVNDLETLPINEWDVTSETAYGADEEGYIQGLAKLYNTISTHELTDISGVDRGATSTIRAFWACQEITTDACKCAWGNDAWVHAMNTNTWSDAENEAVFGVFFRSLQAISYVNEYIRQTEPGKLSSRGVSSDLAKKIQSFRAEARFIRAYYYWMAMDVFGAVPFSTENSAFGAEAPLQASREEVYAYVVSELEALAADDSAIPAAQSNYPRVDRGSVLGLLARVYLNAEVYSGTSEYEKCKQTCEKIFALGYQLSPVYSDLFRGDNGQNPEARQELLFAIDYDSHKTESYGGTSFLTLAAIASTDTENGFINGVNGAWGGIRTTLDYAEKYFDVKNPNYETGEYNVVDERGKFFYIKGRQPRFTTVEEMNTFIYGWSCIKYNNIPHDKTMEEFNEEAKAEAFADIDFPVIRLGEINLIYAEACVRLGQAATAQSYVDALAARAGVETHTLTNNWETEKEWFVAERARELMWEAHRRTDLIRYDLFSSANFLWPFKGGETAAGQGFPEYKELFAIPASQLVANPNLVNPEGY